MTDNIIDHIISDIQNKNFHSAIQRLDSLIDKDPSNHNLYEIKAGCNYALGNYDSAVDDWTYAIINFSSGVDHKKELSVIYSKRGKAQLKSGNYISASEDFSKSLKLYPGSAETLNNLATCMRRMKNYDEALVCVDKAIGLKPDFSDAYNNRGNIHYCMGNVDSALQDYTLAVDHDPANAKAYFNRGSLFYHMHDETKAHEDWEKAVILDGHIKAEIDELHPGFLERQHLHEESKEEMLPVLEEVNKEAEEVNKETEEAAPEEFIPAEDITPGATDETEDISTETALESEDDLLKVTVDEDDNLLDLTVDKEDNVPEPAADFSAVEQSGQIHEEVHEDKIESLSDAFADLHSEKETEAGPETTETKQEEPPLNLDKLREEFSVTSYHDIFENKETELTAPVSADSKTTPDFEIPDLDFKSIFRENQNKTEMETPEEEPMPDKPVIPEEALLLHEEIEKSDSDELKGFKGFTINGGMDSSPAPEPVTHYPQESEEEKSRKKLDFFTSPAFLVVIILGIMIVAVFALYKIMGLGNRNTAETTAVKTDSAVVKTEQATDSAGTKENTASETKKETSSETATEEEVKETVKEETPPPATETARQVSEPKYMGFISDKQKFILFSDKDVFYVQVGSYREKAKAEGIAGELIRKGIKAAVTEVDLKEKGIFYRVKAGPFSTGDEAKQKMSAQE